MHPTGTFQRTFPTIRPDTTEPNSTPRLVRAVCIARFTLANRYFTSDSQVSGFYALSMLYGWLHFVTRLAHAVSFVLATPRHQLLFRFACKCACQLQFFSLSLSLEYRFPSRFNADDRLESVIANMQCIKADLIELSLLETLILCRKGE
jgi:hypothetical protein